MVARFLHYFPQYTLRDLTDGTLSVEEFRLLYAGMTDNLNPEQTEPVAEAMGRRTREAHIRARSKARGGW